MQAPHRSVPMRKVDLYEEKGEKVCTDKKGTEKGRWARKREGWRREGMTRRRDKEGANKTKGMADEVSLEDCHGWDSNPGRWNNYSKVGAVSSGLFSYIFRCL